VKGFTSNLYFQLAFRTERYNYINDQDDRAILLQFAISNSFDIFSGMCCNLLSFTIDIVIHGRPVDMHVISNIPKEHRCLLYAV
jgi:hypothetical protein